MPDLEIISHPLCPMAHRLTLAALKNGWKRGREFSVTLIPYDRFPAEIRRHSPSGDSPALKIGGILRTTTTEFAAEYINCAAGGGMLPTEPDRLLRLRESEKAARDALNLLRGVFVARDAAALEAALAALFNGLGASAHAGAFAALDPQVRHLDDAAWAGFFSLTGDFAGLRHHPLWAQIPQARDLAGAFAANPLVAAARCPDPIQEFAAFFKMTGSAFPNLMAA